MATNYNPVKSSYVKKVSGTSTLSNRSKAAGIGIDTAASNNLKFNKGGTVVTVADSSNITTLGTASGSRKTLVLELTGATVGSATQAVQIPEAGLITQAWLDVTTSSSGACTLDVGYTAVSATTSADNIFDGVSTASSPAPYSMTNASLDSGANIGAKHAAAGAWVTATEASGDATGLVAKLYVEYLVA